MYKVLIADDERVILEGISRFVNWEKLGTELVGMARNGLEAFEMIVQHKPDIVITDIRMPGLDGLQLIAKVRELELPVQFIMLSGFSDFEYARQAIRHGVKDYLLKPCNEKKIEQVIAEVIEDRELVLSKERFMERLQRELKQVLPHAKEQLFKEFVTNKTYGERDWDRYRELLGITSEDELVRLIVFELEANHEFEHLFAMKNIAEDIIGVHNLLLNTTIGSQVLLLVREDEASDSPQKLLAQIEEIRRTFISFYRMDCTTALSDRGLIRYARRLYRETLTCLNHRFYLEEGGLITMQDVMDMDEEQALTDADIDLMFDEDRLSMLIKAGRVDDVRMEIETYFDRLAGVRLEAGVSKTYIITMYLTIIRHEQERLKDMMEEIARLDSMHTLAGLKSVVEQTAVEITERNYDANRRKHSAIISQVLKIIQENLGSPELSLNSVANEMLYMNPDYLGKLFKKETGEKFSNYVTRLRMEKAIEMMANEGDVKIFEIAESLGYGDNPQYFSKVFKRYTGFTPSEFKMS